MQLEYCNRCCSDVNFACYDISKNSVTCSHCGFTEDFEVWQLRGWRRIDLYPPTYSGIIFVYGEKIGRKSAMWDKETGCDNPLATHWLRTPDPRKQIKM